MIKYIIMLFLLAVLQGGDILKIFNIGFLSVVKKSYINVKSSFHSKNYLSYEVDYVSDQMTL